MIGALAICCLLQPRFIELTPRIDRLPHLIKDLARAARLDLKVADNMRNEVLYVNLQSRPSSDWMKFIAEASGGEWLPDKKRFVLTRTPRKVRDDEETDNREMANQIGHTLSFRPIVDRVIDETLAADWIPQMLGQKRGSDAVYAPHQRPAYRMLTQVLKAMPSEWLAKADSGMVVATDRPRYGAIVAPFDLRKMADEAYRECNAYLSALQKNEFYTNSLQESLIGFREKSLPADRRGPWIPYVFVSNDGSRAKVEIHLYNQEGRGMTSAETEFSITAATKTPEAVEGEVGPEWVPVSLLSIVGVYRANSDKLLLETMRHPAESEPLKVVLEEPLNRWISVSKRQCVLSLPDSVASDLLRGSEKVMAGRHLWASVAGSLRHEERDGILIGRPLYPARSHRLRADRVPMEEFIARTPFRTPVGLDSFSVYIVQQSSPVPGNLESGWLHAAIGGHQQHIIHRFGDRFAGRESVRLWRLLSKSDKAKLRGQKKVLVSGLSKEARAVLDRMVCQYESNFTRKFGYTGAPFQFYVQEGLPADSYLQAKVSETPYFVYEDDKGETIWVSTRYQRTDLSNLKATSPLRYGKVINMNFDLVAGPDKRVPLYWADDIATSAPAGSVSPSRR